MKNHWSPELLPELNNQLNFKNQVIPQIVSNSANLLLNAHTQFLEMGYDELNLNMGCPFPMLVKRQLGGGLLAHPNLVKRILEDTFQERPSIKLSIKMRLGVHAPQQWKNIIPILNQFPLTEVIIHPRTVDQQYKGKVQWDEYEAISNRCIHPLTGNGDINSIEDYQQLSQTFQETKRWMLGRGALVNPFLPGMIKGERLDADEMKHVMRQFHDSYLQVIRQHHPLWNHAFNRVKTFWLYPINIFQQGKRHLKKMKKFLTEEDYLSWTDQLFDNHKITL
jgi:tRNA-dihydrouridine synthase